MAFTVIFLGGLSLSGFITASPPADVPPGVAFSLLSVGAALLGVGPVLGNTIRKNSPGPAGFLVTFACWEASAIVGFAHFMMTGQTLTCAVLSIAALTAMLMNWPRGN